MLARALVSDIMVYNRDLYDQAKAKGTGSSNILGTNPDNCGHQKGPKGGNFRQR